MSRESDYIANMRFAATARERPKPRGADDFAWVSPEPIRPVSDPEVAAERARLKAEEDHAARVEVASHVMRSGCEGHLYCPGREHALHLAYGRELLEELGLTPDPKSRGVRRPNGSTPGYQGAGEGE